MRATMESPLEETEETKQTKVITLNLGLRVCFDMPGCYTPISCFPAINQYIFFMGCNYPTVEGKIGKMIYVGANGGCHSAPWHVLAISWGK